MRVYVAPARRHRRHRSNLNGTSWCSNNTCEVKPHSIEEIVFFWTIVIILIIVAFR